MRDFTESQLTLSESMQLPSGQQSSSFATSPSRRRVCFSPCLILAFLTRYRCFCLHIHLHIHTRTCRLMCTRLSCFRNPLVRLHTHSQFPTNLPSARAAHNSGHPTSTTSSSNSTNTTTTSPHPACRYPPGQPACTSYNPYSPPPPSST